MDSREATTRADTVPEPVLTELLDSRRRCHLLVQLDAAGGEQVVDDLAALVWAAEMDCDPDAVDDEARRSVREALFERHLAKLTATGVLEYDSMLGTVELTAPGVASRARERLSDEDTAEDVSKDK